MPAVKGVGHAANAMLLGGKHANSGGRFMPAHRSITALTVCINGMQTWLFCIDYHYRLLFVYNVRLYKD